MLDSTACLAMKSSGLLLLVGLLAFWAELTPTYGQPAICHLPKVVGNCEAYIPRYFFNPDSKKCEKFIYGGCGGNENNFETWKDCHYTCEEKPGTCPKAPPDLVTICLEKCENDWKCPDNQKCCNYACLRDCMIPV